MHPATVSADELTHRIAERTGHIGVIGQGYVGPPLAVEFARVGYAVTGFDTSIDRVTALNAGRSHTPDVPDHAVLTDPPEFDYARIVDLSSLVVDTRGATHRLATTADRVVTL